MTIYVRTNSALSNIILGDVDLWQDVVFTPANPPDSPNDVILLTNLTGTFTRLTGTGFALDANDEPTAGDITLIEHLASDGTTILETYTLSAPYSLLSYRAVVMSYFEPDVMNGNDELIGGTGNDVLLGFNGNDTATGGDGIDIINGGFGDDELSGGNDADDIQGGAGNNTLLGGGGADVFTSATNDGSDQIDGGSEGDVASIFRIASDATYVLDFSNPNVLVTIDDGSSIPTDTTIINVENILFIAGNGNDSIIASNGAQSGIYYNGVAGGAGNDTLTAGTNGATLYGEQDDDRLFGNSGSDVLDGGEGNDTIASGGNASRDDIFGAGGNDSITGAPGSHFVYGGLGNDVISMIAAGAGFTNELYGEGGNDTVVGSLGDDLLSGGDETDTLSYAGFGAVTVTLVSTTAQNTGGAGTDTISGFENLVGGSSGDLLTGNSQRNVLNGGVGNDTVNGGGGNDRVIGGYGHDSLTGGLGSDTLEGGNGSDVLAGGASNDRLYGGTGTDYFIFNTTLGPVNVDAIMDFSVADDTIQLDNAIFTAFGAYTGLLPVGALQIGTAAADAGDRIIYDSATGALYYDADGTGAQAQIQFATLSPGLALTRADFRVI